MRLAALTTRTGKYVLLALDKPVILAEAMELNYSLPEAKAYVDKLVRTALELYVPFVSGYSLSPETQLDFVQKKTGKAGLILPVERTITAVDPFSLPVLAPKWSVEHIRNNYGVAKLALPVASTEKELASKLQLASEIYDSCRYEGIDMVLELPCILDATTQPRSKVYQSVLTLFRRPASLLALEYPGSVVETLPVASQLETPWVLIDPATEYGQVKEQLRDALASGAAGMLIRQSVWPKGKHFAAEATSAEQFLQTEGLDRLKELVRIIEES